eukprot:CAMPEP_0197855434 /NCGR_PEP_ID=MMETSP1438-20131217/26650_1 /TAXON_ID=1461541 /ORGANISM="Pterosperma sp., Strain CCMP1384" /LENGTH=220 /DNA_ID=CAMNT_0043470543 /DNA_START=158 /DNA_END=820 /DNA_ORIENTATION=-
MIGSNRRSTALLKLLGLLSLLQLVSGLIGKDGKHVDGTAYGDDRRWVMDNDILTGTAVEDTPMGRYRKRSPIKGVAAAGVHECMSKEQAHNVFNSWSAQQPASVSPQDVDQRRIEFIQIVRACDRGGDEASGGEATDVAGVGSVEKETKEKKDDGNDVDENDGDGEDVVSVGVDQAQYVFEVWRTSDAAKGMPQEEKRRRLRDYVQIVKAVDNMEDLPPE